MAEATTANAEATRSGDKSEKTTRRKSGIADKVHGLTKQQRIMGGLIACIALTIATIVMLQPDILYTNTQNGTGAQQTNTTSKDKPATASPNNSQVASTTAASPTSSSTPAARATTASAAAPAAAPATSKSYDGQSAPSQPTATQAPLITYPYPVSSPTVQLAQHASPQPITQAQINAWDALTAPGITQPETPAAAPAQPAAPTDDASASPAESVAAPPEVKATKMNLNLSAKHNHESYHAHDDLTINEWQDGYYVLHRNSAAGDDIFSLRPGDTVHIDGMDCTVTQSIDVPASTYFEDIRDKVGWDTVVFHTCHRPASTGLVRIVACRPSSGKTFGVWHNGELIDSNTWMNRIDD